MTKPADFGKPALRRWPVLALGIAAAVSLALTGAGLQLDRGLAIWRNALHAREASGRLALVEIDARSLAALARWPWPRSLYARAITALDQAGARTIALDVDLSAKSIPTEDAALARAIAKSSTAVILPTFRQTASQGTRAEIENLPIPSLRRNAMIAAVNIRADSDGLVRSYPWGVETAGAARPSVGAMLADGAGRSGESFAIDGAIDPATVRRVSFVDLLRDPAEARTLAGRNVLIGASAVELGDRYPMPGRGVIPGPLIQLLAAETILQGSSPVDRGGLLPIMLAAAAMALAAGRRRLARNVGFGAGFAVIFALPFVLEALKLGTMGVVPALGGLVVAWVGAALLEAVATIREARLIDVTSGLPNLTAFNQNLGDIAAGSIVVFRLARASDLAAVLGHAEFGALVGRVAARLATNGRMIFRVEDSAIAWTLLGADSDREEAEIAIARALLAAPMAAGDRMIDLDGGYGVAQRRAGSDAVGCAAAAADAAIAGGRAWSRDSEDVGRAQDWRLRIAGEVDAAMAAGDIWVAYQPKLDIATDTICCAEALVRWRHPERGAITPDAFIPALEESGRIADLTLYVVRQALADARDWAAAGTPIGVAVNVSARLPSDTDFVERLEVVLAAHPAQVAGLTLEVTESATMIDPNGAAAALDRLAALGVTLSIDDYGSGLSTLSYLKRLPAREIKIDKDFVLAIETSRSDQAMVRSTIDLAHELGFRVVAEGVETGEALALLRGYGCDVAQGWHIGRPMPASDLLERLRPRDFQVAA